MVTQRVKEQLSVMRAEEKKTAISYKKDMTAASLEIKKLQGEKDKLVEENKR